MCGTLEIKGLTPELDSLVTFFEGEIVGEVGSPGFRTGRFGATEFDDLKHWRRFPAFTRNRLERGLIKPELNLRTSKNKPYVFLRLKEKHVVNHRVEAIHGASYAGFYYCCESAALSLRGQARADEHRLAGLDCEPSIVPLDSQAAPLHRGISPPSRTLMPTRARRTSSAGARGRPEPSLLAQTRPIAPRTPSTSRLSPPPVVVNLPAVPNGQTALPLVAPAPSRPAQPRRTSSGSISYAAAVRGEAMSTSPSLPELSSSPTASTSSGSPVTPPSIPPVIQVSEPSRPASTDLPTPKAEFPEPAFSIFAPLDSTAPSLPPIWQAVAAGPFSPSYNAAHFGQPAGPSTSPTDEEWPVPVQTTSQVTPPPRPPAALRRMSSDVATVLAKAQGVFGERGRSGRIGGRKSAFPYSAADEDFYGDETDEQGGFDDRGLRSWTEATISGVRLFFALPGSMLTHF